MELRFQLNYRFQGPNAPFLYAADAGYFAGLRARVTAPTGR